MADYKESTVTGTRWSRCRQIRIDNPHSSQGVPTVQFVEEDAIDLGGAVGVIVTPSKLRPIYSIQFDPAEVVDLYDPITGEKTTQTITMGEIYALIFSAYMTHAARRDEQVANPPPLYATPAP